jgi:4-amino-4-deoxy-L-arabinose transferase-like glycosyltransferase
MSLKMLSSLFRFLTKRWILEAVLFVIVALFHLWSLMRFPPPFVDEAWLASRAWSFITTGKAFGTLDAGVFDRFPGHETFFPWLPVVIQSLGLRLFPKPELIAVRFISLFFGLCLVIIIYAIGVRFGGRRLGLLSAFILSFSLPFVYSSHLGRYDIMVSTLGFASIAIFLYQKPPKRFWPSLLAGLLALLAFEIHANGAIYTPVILVLFLSEIGWATLKSRGFWGFVAGALIGGLFYIGLHIIRFPETYLAINQLAFSTTHVPPILTFNPLIIIKGITSTWLLFATFYILVPVLILGFVDLFIGVFKRRTKNDFLLFILTFSTVITYALWIRNQNTYYAILAAPMLTIVTCRFLLDTYKMWQGQILDYINRVSWGLAIVFFGYIIVQVFPNSYIYYRPVQERISQSVHDGEVVMGSQTHWFGLYQHQYYSWETIIYYERLIPGSNFVDVMFEFRPDIFILDGQMLNYFNEVENSENTYKQNLHVPIKDVSYFLEKHAQLVDSFESPIYGPILIYRINWDQVSLSEIPKIMSVWK